MNKEIDGYAQEIGYVSRRDGGRRVATIEECKEATD